MSNDGYSGYWHYESHSITVATTDITYKIPPFRGRPGTLLDVAINPTANFTGSTSEGRVDVGITGTLAKFGTFDLTGVTSGNPERMTDTAGNPVVGESLPADADTLVTYVAPVGTPTGAGTVTVTVGYN